MRDFILPLKLIFGQYLQVFGRLHGVFFNMFNFILNSSGRGPNQAVGKIFISPLAENNGIID